MRTRDVTEVLTLAMLSDGVGRIKTSDTIPGMTFVCSMVLLNCKPFQWNTFHCLQKCFAPLPFVEPVISLPFHKSEVLRIFIIREPWLPELVTFTRKRVLPLILHHFVIMCLLLPAVRYGILEKYGPLVPFSSTA